MASWHTACSSCGPIRRCGVSARLSERSQPRIECGYVERWPKKAAQGVVHSCNPSHGHCTSVAIAKLDPPLPVDVEDKLLSFVRCHGEIPPDAHRITEDGAVRHSASWVRRNLGVGTVSAYVLGFESGDSWWTVDDHADLLAALELFFKSRDFDVACASDGIEALARIEEQRPDLVITDHLMPRMTGLQTVRASASATGNPRPSHCLAFESSVRPREVAIRSGDLEGFAFG